jgi:four helix bundle protein
VTVRFCDRYIEKRSRTHDQMVQAARSGVQNIAEGSQASGTSRKTELKLTNVARASLEELRLDYEAISQNGSTECAAKGEPVAKLTEFYKNARSTAPPIKTLLQMNCNMVPAGLLVLYDRTERLRAAQPYLPTC